MSVAVGDTDAIDIEIEPSRTTHVDQPDRLRACTTRAASAMAGYNTAAVSCLVGPRLMAHGDGNDRISHSYERVDRRDSGRVAVCRAIGGGKRRGASRQGEVVQRGKDHRRVLFGLRRRRNSAPRLLGLTESDGDVLV